MSEKTKVSGISSASLTPTPQLFQVQLCCASWWLSTPRLYGFGSMVLGLPFTFFGLSFSLRFLSTAIHGWVNMGQYLSFSPVNQGCTWQLPAMFLRQNQGIDPVVIHSRFGAWATGAKSFSPQITRCWRNRSPDLRRKGWDPQAERLKKCRFDA